MIDGLSLTADILGLDISRVNYGDDFVVVKLAGLSTGNFTVALQINPLPLPATGLLLAADLADLTRQRGHVKN